MLYRVKQLYNTVFSRVKQSEYNWVAEVLNQKELILFHKQPLPEQRHAIDVASEINRRQSLIKKQYGTSQYENLLKAALLHDCGKSLIKYHIWQRILIVLIGYFPDKYKKKIIRQKNIIGRTLLLYQLHPKWGKYLVAKIGMNENVQELILNHHTPHNQLAKLLAQYDNLH